ncbi:MAG: hypothetical protein MR939_05245 [Clostridiales bacterium]|nr:hypothetical protein [Clostridiales bacterium]MDD7387275.1 hypothetical protein [Bacillota bacterium]
MVRRMLDKLSAWMRRFMAGRYGTDQLNMAILGAGLVLCIISMFIRIPQLNLLMTTISYALVFWAVFRTFSRNTYKRYEENRKFRQFFDRLKDREHRYYTCPKCHQSVRVPRGKGKIAITCPRCRERFVRKT